MGGSEIVQSAEDAATVTVGTVGTISGAAVGSKQTTQTQLLSEQVDIFDAPPIETGLLFLKSRLIRPLEPLEGNREFTFQFPSYSARYLNGKELRLVGVLHVEKSQDGISWSSLDSSDEGKVSLHQFFASTIWESAQVMVRGSIASSIATKDYPYKCIFENLLSFDKSSSTFHQICQGYAPDKVKCFDSMSDGPYKTRSQWLTQGDGKIGYDRQSSKATMTMLTMCILKIQHCAQHRLSESEPAPAGQSSYVSVSAAGR